MATRRIVTGLNEHGKSTILSDGPTPNHHEMKTAPGFARSIVWLTDSGAALPVEGDPSASLEDMHPLPGASVGLVLTLPPASSMAAEDFDPQAFVEEGLIHNKGIFDRMDPDGSGMHATDTIDYNVVLEGELWVVTDDGSKRAVRQGDVVIHTGVRHAWINQSDRPARLFTVLVGAKPGGA